ncbi:MAG TPA: amidohydrolase family protein [Blastocatellia bacterium]|nr:amidohydrolase family protein [Blastocatellia bacterium]
MSTILIKNGRIIDGTGKAPVENASILIENGRFKEVAERDIEAPPRADVIDASGKTIIPGLIDMHAHLLSGGFDTITDVIDSFDPETQKSALRRMLYWGVTSLYNPVQPLESGLRLRAQAVEGGLPSPRLFISGPGFTAPDGWAGSLLPIARMEPRDAHEAEQQVSRLADAGVDILKIYYDTQCCAFVNPLPKMERAILERIIEKAHARGMKVMVHAYDTQYHKDALRAGADILAHSAVTAPVDDEYIELARRNRALYLATLSVYHDAFDEKELRGFMACDFVQKTVPKKTLDSLAEGGPLDGFLKITRKDYIKGQLPTIQANLRRVFESGIRIGVGPDTGVMGAFPGISVHREMELMAQAGIPPAQVLVAATSTAAEFLGEESLGSIERGKAADAVIIEGDTLQDIRNTRNIVLVIKDGRVIDREALLRD